MENRKLHKQSGALECSEIIKGELKFCFYLMYSFVFTGIQISPWILVSYWNSTFLKLNWEMPTLQSTHSNLPKQSTYQLFLIHVLCNAKTTSNRSPLLPVCSDATPASNLHCRITYAKPRVECAPLVAKRSPVQNLRDGEQKRREEERKCHKGSSKQKYTREK